MKNMLIYKGWIDMKLQWYGTASISVDTNNEKILFNPFIPFKESNINIKLEDF